MIPTGQDTQRNPLTSFMRQPKIFIRLPSNGEYWAPGSLELSETGEYPVFSMTARDELLLKVPDALMNGQAVVDVIQNCIPHIKNAWEVPSIDMDVILIAIRIATYGENYITPISVGDNEFEYSADLRSVMDSLMNQIIWDSHIPINDDLTIFVKPINYKKITEMSISSFETQKIMQVANNENIPEEEKIKIFQDSFNKLTKSTIGLVASSIYRIDSSQGSTEDPRHIAEFINNVDKTIFNAIQEHLDKLKDLNEIKPIKVPVTDEMKEKGFKGEFVEFPLIFDASTFFA